MGHEGRDYSSNGNTNENHENNMAAIKTTDMSKADRKALLLGYLVHTGLALPPAVLYRNLRLQQNATFGEKTLNNYLDELADEGLVKRIDPHAMEHREVVEIEDGRGYWIATKAGREESKDSFTFR